MEVKMTPVSSSNIAAIGYDGESRTLFVQFVKGGEYSYSPITEDGYRELLKAPSVGGYFAANIKNNETLTVNKL